jgi:dipeptidase
VRGVYTISNGLTITNDWDLVSPQLVTHALQQGWYKGTEPFDFAGCYSDLIYTRFSDCRSRRRRTTELLESLRGSITPATLMATLQDHGEKRGEPFRPDRGLTGAEVCMHASFGPVRASQTTGSMVSHLNPGGATHFVTATAAPCTSLFKPVWLDAPLPDTGPMPTGTYDPATLYWRHEALHRATLRDYATFIQLYQEEREVQQHRMVGDAMNARETAPSERGSFGAGCFAEAAQAEDGWLERVSSAEVQHRRGLLHDWAWSKFDREAQMPA